MNGRVYDPLTAVFLSPDPYIQYPDRWLNYNRYSYALNNPFKYTDPTGEELITALIVTAGAIIGTYLGGTAANGGELNPFQWDWSDPMTYGMMGVGAIIGAVAGYGLAVPGSIVLTVGVEIYSPWLSAGIGVTGITATGSASDWKFQWSTSAGGGGELPLKEKELDKYPKTKRPKWDGRYFQGSESEAQSMLLDISKKTGLEATYWSTSKGYYFEPIQGEAYDMDYEEIYDFYPSINRFDIIDYNTYVGFQKNTYKGAYRYTEVEQTIDGLYLRPSIFEMSRIYYHAHTHPRSSPPGNSDIVFASLLLKIRGKVLGWNGTIYNF